VAEEEEKVASRVAKHLTKRAVDQARYSSNGAHGRGHHVLWDSSVRGFGLRVHPSGRKTFVVFYRAAGRKRLLSLGGYPELTVDQARRLAREKLLTVAGGADPVEDARKERQRSVTFGELARRFLEEHAKVHKKSVRDDEQRIEDYLEKAWGPKPAASVRRADVAELHLKIGTKAPYSANRTLSLVSKIFNWGAIAGILPEGHPNPARGLVRFKECSRDRFLSPDEAGQLLGAIDAEPNVYIRAFFWLSLLLGTRKNELLRARWEDVDLNGAVLRLPETKALHAGRRLRAHHIPLSEPAMKIFRTLPRESGNPFVFPGMREGQSLVNVEKAWNRARQMASVRDVRFHDLRRTVGSWLAQRGASLGLIGAVLNHTQSQTTAIYARFGEANTREALEGHAAAVLEARNQHIGDTPRT
jgi:integrase